MIVKGKNKQSKNTVQRHNDTNKLNNTLVNFIFVCLIRIQEMGIA